MNRHNTSSSKAARASAPGKVILFGEHFVVYDAPAILAAITRRVEVSAKLNDSKIMIRSDMGLSVEYAFGNPEERAGSSAQDQESARFLDPLYQLVRDLLVKENTTHGIEVEISSKVSHGIGLGSSAACCVAVAAAVSLLLPSCRSDKINVCKIATESERLIHSNSSGADCFVCTFGGLIQYSRSRGFSNIESNHPPLSFIVADTGVKHSTAELVSLVKKFRETNQSQFDNLANEATLICRQALDAIKNRNLEKLGNLMNQNHTLLQKLGVSHQRTDQLVDICLNAGAIGAKLTGAGGGGAILALADGSAKQTIASKIMDKGFRCFEAEIDYDGLKISL
jgi:mevalonate kinase